MNLFDYAMQLEKEGETLYTELSKSAPDKGMATIFTVLAAQEKRHYEIFKKMKENQNAAVPEVPFLNTVKSIFAEWKNKKDKFDFKTSQADLYRKALDIEQKSIDFYTEKSNEVNDATQKDIFEKIIKEEKTHYTIMDTIIELITNPKRWVENAEFSKIGEEY